MGRSDPDLGPRGRARGGGLKPCLGDDEIAVVPDTGHNLVGGVPPKPPRRCRLQQLEINAQRKRPVWHEITRGWRTLTTHCAQGKLAGQDDRDQGEEKTIEFRLSGKQDVSKGSGETRRRLPARRPWRQVTGRATSLSFQHVHPPAAGMVARARPSVLGGDIPWPIAH